MKLAVPIVQSHNFRSPLMVISKVRHMSRDGTKSDFRPTIIIIIIASETN